MRQFCALIIGLLCQLCQAKVWSECGTAQAGVVLKEVVIDNCNEAPCEVKGGQTVSGLLRFETTQAIPPGLSCKVLGIIGGAKLPFPGQTTCQLKEGAKDGIGMNTYEVGLTVPTSVPKVAVKGQWNLKTADDKEYLCFEIDIDLK